MHRRNRLALIAVAAATALVVSATSAAADPGPVRDRVGAPGPLLDLRFGIDQPETPRSGAPNSRPRSGVVNVAHRGASAYAPENTLAAFRLAKARHADVFELDVQQTKDHKLVVIHDTTLARTTNVEKVYPRRRPWRVADFTLAEIGKLDAGSWFAAKYKGERVPTLARVLAAMRGAGLGMRLEIKSPALYPGIERRIAAALKRSPSWLRPDPSERRLAVQSFDWGSVRRFHAVLPRVPTGLLGTPKAADLPRLASYADQINPQFRGLTASYVKKVHASRMDVLTWTVNARGDMRKAVRLGVDGIITNKPDVLRQVLRASRARSAEAA